MKRFLSWRGLFVIGGLVVFFGGPQHPRGTMLEMLNDPGWVSAHLWILFGLLILSIGLWLFRKSNEPSKPLDTWLLFAIVMTFLEALEMGIHTMAYVDKEALSIGESTPVLTTHLWLMAIVYPVFAIAVVGLIWHGFKSNKLGSPWIAWLGIIGAVGHGLAGFLTVATDLPWAPMLFPLLVGLAVWFVLAGFWPDKAPLAVEE